jgi:hypothetical protein
MHRRRSDRRGRRDVARNWEIRKNLLTISAAVLITPENMKKVPFGIAAAAAGLFFTYSIARAQSEDEPQPVTSRALAATIDYGNDAVFQPIKHGVDFDEFGLDPGQTVTLTVQFPVELAGQPIIAEPLDGGLLTVPDEGLFVNSDGMVVMQFQAGTDSPGACRIAVHQPDDSNILHFWIVDPDHPENTPANLPGAY